MKRSDIQARVLKTGQISLLRGLLDERRFVFGLGRVTDVESIDRTIEDLAGFYEDGKFYGARVIIAAFSGAA